jgi:imidazolonepropionase-like amidohydrolase
MMIMPSSKLWLGLVLFSAGCVAAEQPDPPRLAAGALILENARVIIGDGQVVENGAIVIEGQRVTQVGRADQVRAPAGAARIDLTGKTVMPAMIDAHAHLGYEGHLTWRGENYTRENVIDHLNRYAYYGFSAVFTTGTDPDELLTQIQREQEAGRFGGARVIFAAGMAPPGQGPNAQLLQTAAVLNRTIVRGARTPEEGREAVREIARLQILFIKVWVDDRGGTQERLARPVFEAIIDEASRNGIRVVAHQQNVQDMKELLEAGVAGFLHGRLGPSIDQELVALMRRNGAFVVPNVGLTERGQEMVHEDPFLHESLGEEALARLRSAHSVGMGFVARPRNTEEQERNVRQGFQTLLNGGVDIVLGTDAGAVPDHFFGYTGHRELEIFIRLGMTPEQAIVAATSAPARHLGLDDLGTIAPGKSADLIVLDANPLDDIRNTRRIADVYLRGERLDREAMRSHFLEM